MGAQTEAQIKAFLERIVKTTGATSDEGLSVDSALKQAAEFLETKHIAEAQSIYAEIFAHDPANAIAYAGLMRCLIEAGDMAAAKDMLAKAPTAIAANKALDSVRATIELADQAAAKGSYADIKIKVDQNPADHQGRFDLALAYYAAGQKEQAVDELLEIIRRQRSWNEDAARKQLVKFFEAFGPTDPLTISARRRLSSILFS
jgi:putative thioredoxin